MTFVSSHKATVSFNAAGKVTSRSRTSACAVGPVLHVPKGVAVAERAAVNVDNVVLVDSKQMLLSDLAAMANEGRLQVQPDVKNTLVWNSRKMASSLVVPVIQGKETPPIMLEASDCGSLRVLGGTPRLTSLLAFVTGSRTVGGEHWPSAPVELDARDQAIIRWNGKTFEQLPDDTKQRVNEYALTCLFVKSNSDA